MPDDRVLFDFPCSYDFRCFEAAQYGEYLPSIDPPELKAILPLAPEPEWTHRQWEHIQNLRSLVNHLQKKLNEHTTLTKRKKGQY